MFSAPRNPILLGIEFLDLRILVNDVMSGESTSRPTNSGAHFPSLFFGAHSFG